MQEVLVSSLALLGSLLMMLASIGIVRMPDLFLRLQVTSKASVLGLAFILLAVAIHFSHTVVTVRVIVIICFVVLTIPVATHMIARAGYTTNVPLSEETVVNELAGHYDPQLHVLSSDEPETWSVDISPDAEVVGKQVLELALPRDVLILAIQRHGEVVVPRGQTVLQAEDRLRVLARPEHLEVVQQVLGSVDSPSDR